MPFPACAVHGLSPERHKLLFDVTEDGRLDCVSAYRPGLLARLELRTTGQWNA